MNRRWLTTLAVAGSTVIAAGGINAVFAQNQPQIEMTAFGKTASRAQLELLGNIKVATDTANVAQLARNTVNAWNIMQILEGKKPEPNDPNRQVYDVAVAQFGGPKKSQDSAFSALAKAHVRMIMLLSSKWQTAEDLESARRAGLDTATEAAISGMSSIIIGRKINSNNKSTRERYWSANYSGCASALEGLNAIVNGAATQWEPWSIPQIHEGKK